MIIPYIKIQQKNEVFFVTKFKAKELRKHVDFHFRNPYSDESVKKESYSEYIRKIQQKGIEIRADEEGVQRRIQYDRILKIKRYLEGDEKAFFPTSVVLATDVSRDENLLLNYEEIEEKDCGEIELSDDVTFQIVDGQHRLAGLFISNEDIVDSFEISAVLLLNATRNTCARVFSDINGNQAKVNKSIIYDLYDVMDINSEEEENKRKLHVVCDKLNTDPKSALYRHIKMLGIGQGAISQAFLIQYLYDALKEVDCLNCSEQEIYNLFYVYFRCFQKTFPEYWPVKEYHDDINYEDFLRYSDKVLKKDKSQLLKTNGIGAIMLSFPYIYKHVGWEGDNVKEKYEKYLSTIMRLKGKIDWSNDETIKMGTGKKIMSLMRDKIIKYLEL